MEKETVAAMTKIFCRMEHGVSSLCPACSDVLRYAHFRLDRCVFQERKPTCLKCPIHCYGADMKLKIKEIMRRAGPRMMFRHPWLTLNHFLKEKLRRKPLKYTRQSSA